jgi:hypothetical protein
MKWLAVFALLTIPVTAYAPLEKKYCPTETHWHYHIPDELQIDMELFTFKQLEELRLRGQMCNDDPHCLEIWPISGERLRKLKSELKSRRAGVVVPVGDSSVRNTP